jgi:uncharacterized paraquat-inducible protein A
MMTQAFAHPRMGATMIEADPRQYLPSDYLVTWACPACEHVSEIRLGTLETAHCLECDHALSEEDKSSLAAFRRLIA